MPGAIVQLVAYGIEDLYLTGDPQITFFKILYRRHTNFSIESVIQNFIVQPKFGETVSCTLARVGDLIGQTFLHVEIPAIPSFVDPITGKVDQVKKFAWVNNLGYALIREIRVEIGGKLIDKQYGEWLYIWSQVSSRQDEALNKMIGNLPILYNFSNGKPGYNLYIPLNFWFCRHYSLSLPIIAMASTDIKITVSFRRLEECYRIGPTNSIDLTSNIIPFKAGDYIEQTTNGQTIYGYVTGFSYIQKKLYYIKIQSPSAIKKQFDSINRIYNSITRSYVTPNSTSKEFVEPIGLTGQSSQPLIGRCFFYVNYTYLDTDERNKLVRSNHEYLIEQIQFNQAVGITSPNVRQNLSLDNPCKAMYWVAQLDSLVGPGTINDLFNYTDSILHQRIPQTDAITEPNIINRDYIAYENFQGDAIGSDLVKEATLMLNSHPRFNVRGSEYFNLVSPYQHHYRGPTIGINVYSPAIYPEDIQPSSAINMSKVDEIEIDIKLSLRVNPQNTVRIRNYTINYNILRIFFNLGALAFDYTG